MPVAHAGTVQYVYDAVGRLIAVIDPGSETTTYTYDEAGNLTAVSRNSSAQVSIISFSPARGAVGATVTIAGTGFSATPSQNAVTFNGTPAAVSASTTTSIVTSVPAGATTGPISITAPQGSATSAAAFTVVVPQPPVIDALEPSIVMPGAAFNVAGSSFETVAAENSARVNLSSAIVLAGTDTVLTVRAPSATGGRVSVTTALGSATSAADLFIVPPGHVAADVGATARVTIDAPGAALSLPASKIGLVLFDGTAGDIGVRITASAVSLPSGGSLTVYRPDGAVLVSQTGFGTGGTTLTLPTLPATGTYGVRVTSSSGSGNVTIGAWRDIRGTIAPDTPVDVAITNPGQVARLTFTVAAGENVGVDLRNVTLPAGGQLQVFNSSGSNIISPSFGAGGISARIGTLSAGTYTIVITPASSGTGSVRVTVWRDVGGQLAVDAPVNTSVVYGNQQIQMTFTIAQSGQAAGLRLANPAFAGQLLVFNSAGSNIISPSFSAGSGLSARIGSMSAGTYRVVVIPAAGATGNVQLTLWTDVTGTLALDAPATKTVAYGHQQIQLAFEITQAGQNVGLRVSNPAFAGQLLVFTSSGSNIISPSFSAGSGISARIGAMSVGSYKVVVIPTAGATGAAELTLWQDVPGALNVGELNSITVQHPNQHVRKTFTISSPQTLGIDVANFVGFTSGQLQVFTPSGSNIIAPTFTTASGIGARLGTLTQPGTYTVVVIPGAPGTGTFDMRLWTDVAETLAVDAPLDVTVAHRFQQARFTFVLPSAQNVGIDLSNVTLPAGGQLQVFNSAGSNIISPVFGTGGISARLGTLSAGTYTAVVLPTNGAIGAFRATLWRDVGGQLALDTPVAANVVYGNQQIEMTFAITQAGQNVGLRVSNPAFAGQLLVFTSSGSNIISPSFSAGSGLSARIGALSVGTYRVNVIPTAGAKGAVELTLWQDVPGVLNVGELSSVTVQHPNQQVRKTFSISSPQTLGIDLANFAGFTSGQLQVFSPSGFNIISPSFTTASGVGSRIGTLSQIGTYTVVVIPGSSGSGTFDMRLWSDVGDTLTVDTPYALSIPNRNQQARLPFVISGSETLRLVISGVAMPAGGNAALVTSSGFQITNIAFGPGGVTQDYPTLSAGTYFVSIVPASSGTGTMTVEVERR